MVEKIKISRTTMSIVNLVVKVYLVIFIHPNVGYFRDQMSKVFMVLSIHDGNLIEVFDLVVSKDDDSVITKNFEEGKVVDVPDLNIFRIFNLTF